MLFVLTVNGLNIAWSMNKRVLQKEATKIRALKKSLHVEVIKDDLHRKAS